MNALEQVSRLSQFKNIPAENPQLRRFAQAWELLIAVGIPDQAMNKQITFVLLAMCNLDAKRPWSSAHRTWRSVTEAMSAMATDFNELPKGRNGAAAYKQNTRENTRKQGVKPLLSAGILEQQDASMAPNNQNNRYGISDTFLALARQCDDITSSLYEQALKTFTAQHESLSKKWGTARSQHEIPLMIDGESVALGPGKHSALIAAVVSRFAPRFVPSAEVLYLDDTGNRSGIHRQERLTELGITIPDHGKNPDVVLYDTKRTWLVLVEAVTSVGPMTPERVGELRALFTGSTTPIVFVSAFPDRATFRRFAPALAWETEVWLSDEPGHMIHYNGDRFLGPHAPR